jgi:hypothetical protein
LPLIDKELNGDHRLGGGDIERWPSEFRHSLLLAVFALVLVAVRVVDHIAGNPLPVSRLSLSSDVLTIIATFVLAAAMLRVVDLLALRREIADRAKRSQMLSEEIRQHLRTRQSEGEEQASTIDPAAMIERARRPGA